MDTIYTIEKKIKHLHITAPYSEAMNSFYHTIGAIWHNPCRVAKTKYFDCILNELTYHFGDPHDTPVDLLIEVNTLRVRDRLMIAGIPCIQVDVLEKKFELSQNTYILNTNNYNNWIKREVDIKNSSYFYTKKIYGFFNPFKIKNANLLVTAISNQRAQEFIDTNPRWIKKVSIIPSQSDRIYERKKGMYEISINYYKY